MSMAAYLCSASPETLIKTLDLINIEDARVMVTANMRNPAVRPSPTRKGAPDRKAGNGRDAAGRQ